MCPGNNPTPVTITFTATTEVPWPPGISDGRNHIGVGEGGDKDFTTEVVPNQKVIFKFGGDITGFTKIKEENDLFKTDPSSGNNWTGVTGDPKNVLTGKYTVWYNVKGSKNNPHHQDPKLQMKQ